MTSSDLLVIILLAVLIVAAGVIVAMGLRQHSRDQWKTRLKRTSESLRTGLPLPSVEKEIATQKVSFETLWAEDSQPGSAYLEFNRKASPGPLAPEPATGTDRHIA